MSQKKFVEIKTNKNEELKNSMKQIKQQRPFHVI